ncbi:hypothetical protein VV867_12535 [Pseudomonas sp. JH-2]|uniref:hypothetical protein n=1 Tax=Pseudomonas sp. JH-2 TaxID=3114998 RepID=UPI002E266284|nr:hypothetical protein [Pseudomonas sp. JH-2]
MNKQPDSTPSIEKTLIKHVLRYCKRAREAQGSNGVETNAWQAFGALYLANESQSISSDLFGRLHDLTNSAQHERAMELIYGAPAYTGGERAKAWRDANWTAA